MLPTACFQSMSRPDQNVLLSPCSLKLSGKPMELHLLSATIYENKNLHYEC